MLKWELIETAPKNGQYFLLAGEDGIDIGHWNADWDCWERMHTADYDNVYAKIAEPTHWSHLPAVPKVHP